MNSFKIIFYLLISLLFFISNASTKPELKYYKEYLKKCSSSNIELYKLKEEVIILSSLNLKLDCLKEIFYNHLKRFPVKSWSDDNPVGFDEKIIRDKKNIIADINYTYIKITSLYSQKCGEKCTFSDESILIEKNNFWYFLGDNDKGIVAKFLNDKNILIQNLNSTHTRNYVFNINSKKIYNLPTGNLKFEKDYILVQGQKSYFIEHGAFWFDYKINYFGEIIELINNGKNCKKITSFNKKIQIAMNKQMLKEFCVNTY